MFKKKQKRTAEKPACNMPFASLGGEPRGHRLVVGLKLQNDISTWFLLMIKYTYYSRNVNTLMSFCQPNKEGGFPAKASLSSTNAARRKKGPESEWAGKVKN